MGLIQLDLICFVCVCVWIGLDWMDWIGLDWIGLDWIDWIGLDSIGLV